MRYNHNYITLTVNEPLSAEDAKRWVETARSIAPNGVLSSADIMVNGHSKSTDFYSKSDGNRVAYVIPLSRDLLEDEAGKIAIAWDRTWTAGDFEINFSQLEQSQQRKNEQKQRIVDEIARQAAKQLHSDWVNEKVSFQWGYGPKYSPAQKKHPMLVPWERLPLRQQAQEIERVTKLFDFLESINLRLSKK